MKTLLLLLVFSILPFSLNGVVNTKIDYINKKDTISILYELEESNYYDFTEYKKAVAKGETKGKYYLWQYGSGDGCGKYQMGYYARKLTGYGHINKRTFVNMGYFDKAPDRVKQQIFDKIWSEAQQEKAMDSLIHYMINYTEKYVGMTFQKYVESLNKFSGVEITDAMVIGGMHYVGLENFVSISKTGNYYSFANAYGYSLWECMLRYKGIHLNKKRYKWKINKLQKNEMKNISTSTIFTFEIGKVTPFVTTKNLKRI